MIGFVIILSWATSVTAGHTKRTTTNAILLIAYCIGNSAGPFMWQAKYAPRNYVPWGITAGCVSVCGIVSLVLRWMLVRENALRDKEEYDSTYDDLYVEHVTPEGESVKIKVPKVQNPLLFAFSVANLTSCPYTRNSWISRIDRTANSATFSNPVQVRFFVTQ